MLWSFLTNSDWRRSHMWLFYFSRQLLFRQPLLLVPRDPCGRHTVISGDGKRRYGPLCSYFGGGTLQIGLNCTHRGRSWRERSSWRSSNIPGRTVSLPGGPRPAERGRQSGRFHRFSRICGHQHQKEDGRQNRWGLFVTSHALEVGMPR